MRLIIYSAIASALVFGGIVYATHTTPENKTVELLSTRIVVGPDGPDLRHYVCSGGFISPDGLILTAKHCVDGVDSITV